ncbi:ABC transporter permease [Acidisoma cladoniae]|jgi:ribose transport system permease protein|uniref:ABC transporter permease n=1 Tax=Acidisoma cladoniae TaxID=3040935 RepID=UPI00254AB401|nr:ABC transporter permease [Acidisoma sp. PAMC 29798]
MSSFASPMVTPRRASGAALFLRHNRGVLIIAAVFIVLFLISIGFSGGAFGYFEASFMSSGGATLALAAMGQALIILVGGFDLSVGAVVSLVNVVLATQMGTSLGSEIGVGVLGIAVGGAVGAFNGFFVAFLGLQPIVVTLSTMFLVRGITVLVLDSPGGSIADGFKNFFTGAAIPNMLPASLLVIVAAVIVWLLLKATRFGVSIYAIGSDEESARSAGIPVRRTKFITYVIGGMFYGAAGVFISAQTGAGDPLIGDPLLLETFAAVVLGGTVLGGGRGGLIGAIFGAYTLMLMVNILLALNVSAYYSSVAEGVVLILAVLVAALHKDAPVAQIAQQMRRRLRAWRAGLLPSQIRWADATHHVGRLGSAVALRTPRVTWMQRHRERLRFALPAYLCVAGVLIATALVRPDTIDHWSYYNSLIVLSSFLIVLALGQGTVILTGGLDLSVPWVIGFCGILAAGMIHGSNAASVWVVPMVLVLGALIGMVNGLGIVVLGLPPIVITLAMNGILQGAALVFSNGTPDGFSSPGLHWFMTGHIAGIAPVVVFIALFVIGSVVLLGGTVFGRRVYAVGNSALVAKLSGVNVPRTLVLVYGLSGFCAALVGVMLTGFSGQASLGMGDDYLLPSIAVVVVGGTLITGGRGHYLGMLGGALLLTALQTLLDGTNLPHAVRDIIFGLVVLGAVLALRERSSR